MSSAGKASRPFTSALGELKASRLIRPCEEIHGDVGAGFPVGFHGGELGGLHFRDDLRVMVALKAEQQDEDQGEGRGDAHGTLEQIQLVLAEQVPRGDAEHKEAAEHPCGENRMEILAPCEGVGHDIKEAGQLGAAVLDDVADGVLHPAVGEDDPQGGQVRGDGHKPDRGQVDLLAHALPAERPHRKEGGLKEEGGRGFDGQQRAEDVAHIFRVARPVGPELEFEGDPGYDAEDEVDEEQLSPKLDHSFVHFIARADVERLHDGEKNHESEGQRDKDEVEKDGHGKLQP